MRGKDKLIGGNVNGAQSVFFLPKRRGEGSPAGGITERGDQLGGGGSSGESPRYDIHRHYLLQKNKNFNPT